MAGPASSSAVPVSLLPRCARIRRMELGIAGTAKELTEAGGTVYDQAVDVTQPEQLQDFVARSVEALGDIEFLVNNAGRARPGDFETLADEDWYADLDVKLLSMIRCTREVLPHMRARGR